MIFGKEDLPEVKGSLDLHWNHLCEKPFSAQGESYTPQVQLCKPRFCLGMQWQLYKNNASASIVVGSLFILAYDFSLSI